MRNKKNTIIYLKNIVRSKRRKKSFPIKYYNNEEGD
jgi:hypothetical protein